MRQVVDKYFELIDSGIKCEEDQHVFFEKYQDAYYDNGPYFIEFTDIGLNLS